MTTPVPDGACPTAGCLRPVGHDDTHCIVPTDASDDDLCTSQFPGDELHFGQLCNLLARHDGRHSAFAEVGPEWRRHLVWTDTHVPTAGEAPDA